MRVRSSFGVQWLLYGGIVALFFYAYADTIKWLWHYWIKEQNWQFLVFFAFLYMLWERKESFLTLERIPNVPWGATLLALACAILIAGQVSGTQSLRELSLIISIFGLVLLLFGRHYLHRLFWPLSYLILMTSLPSDLLDNLRDPLKLISATVSADMLQLGGYAVFRDGTFLHLPHMVLEVADTCSGLNQLISAVALGVPIAYTILDKGWKRVFIILLSCVFALVMNWVRVVLISIWHYDSAKEVIHGPYGIYELPFIFLFGVFLTLLVAFAIADTSSVRVKRHSVAVSPGSPYQTQARKFTRASSVAIMVLSANAVYLGTWEAEPVYLQNGFYDFSTAIAGYNGKPITELGKPFYTDLAHNELIMSYTNAAGSSANVYIGYFHSQNQEEEVIDYRYNWLHKGASTIELSSSGPEIQMKLASVRTGRGKSRVLFCYDINGRNIIDPKRAKLASLMDALIRYRTNGAIIIVQLDGESGEVTGNERAFVKQVVIEAQKLLSRAKTS